MQHLYKITSHDGIDFGLFEAPTPACALDQLARSAGYADSADAAKQVGAFEGTVAQLDHD